jgi:protein TonB
MFSHVLKGSVFAVTLVAANFAFAASDAPAAYTKSVMDIVSSHVEYPKMAKMRHQEGATVVAFAVDAKGTPNNPTIEKSSGFESLDAAALNAVKAAGPFPAPTEAGTLVRGSIRFAE